MTDATAFYLEEMGVDGGATKHGPFELGQVYGARTNDVDYEGSGGSAIFLPIIWRDRKRLKRDPLSLLASSDRRVTVVVDKAVRIAQWALRLIYPTGNTRIHERIKAPTVSVYRLLSSET